MLATETNTQYAHAVIFGELRPNEASHFCVWLSKNGIRGGDPAENLKLYLDDLNGD